jgi:hypothetical protein
MSELNLSLEKQFVHADFSNQVKALSHEQSQKMLIDLHHAYLVQQEFYTNFLKQHIKGEVSGLLEVVNGQAD